MIKCQVIENFNLEEFYKLSNIVRVGGRNDKGKLYVGDTFQCDEDMVKYLTGNNEQGKTVVKVIEVEPKLNELGNPVGTREIKPKKKKSSKK